eukprot:11177644-Lingulodinium_polyedra.AAC.1
MANSAPQHARRAGRDGLRSGGGLTRPPTARPLQDAKPLLQPHAQIDGTHSPIPNVNDPDTLVGGCVKPRIAFTG